MHQKVITNAKHSLLACLLARFRQAAEGGNRNNWSSLAMKLCHIIIPVCILHLYLLPQATAFHPPTLSSTCTSTFPLLLVRTCPLAVSTGSCGRHLTRTFLAFPPLVHPDAEKVTSGCHLEVRLSLLRPSEVGRPSSGSSLMHPDLERMALRCLFRLFLRAPADPRKRWPAPSQRSYQVLYQPLKMGFMTAFP